MRTWKVELGEHGNKRKRGATKGRVPFEIKPLENLRYWEFILRILLLISLSNILQQMVP